jgi:hypothetical protein
MFRSYDHHQEAYSRYTICFGPKTIIMVFASTLIYALCNEHKPPNVYYINN